MESKNPCSVVRVIGHGMQDIRVRADGSAWLTDDDGRDALQIAEAGTVDEHTPEATLQHLADESCEEALRREEAAARRATAERISPNVPAFRATSGADHVAAAFRALAELSADVEQGSTRLMSYPAALPSLDELAAAVGNIETAPTLTHDQLAAFGRLAHEASIGSLVDGNGACADLSIETLSARNAIVRSGGAVVATITPEGEVSYR